MSELGSESTPVRTDAPQKRGNRVLVVAIVAVAVVALALIAACTVTVYAFIANAPW